MYNHAFPVTIVDNFLDDPFGVIELANKQKFYRDEEGKWPGLRTVNIAEVAPYFFERTIKKFFSMFYNDKESYYNFVCGMYFQKVGSKYDDGWIHSDSGSILSAIVYLNTNPAPNSGTSIYMPNTVDFNTSLHVEDKKESYKNGVDSPDKRKEINQQFHESIVVKNRFNRLIAFDGHIHHKASFEQNKQKDDRLTLVFFIEKFVTSDDYPLFRLRQII